MNPTVKEQAQSLPVISEKYPTTRVRKTLCAQHRPGSMLRSQCIEPSQGKDVTAQCFWGHRGTGSKELAQESIKGFKPGRLAAQIKLSLKISSTPPPYKMHKIKVVKSTTVQVGSADCYCDCNSNKARGQAVGLSKWRSQRTIPMKTKNDSYKLMMKSQLLKFPWPQWTETNEHIPLRLIHIRQEEKKPITGAPKPRCASLPLCTQHGDHLHTHSQFMLHAYYCTLQTDS